MRLYKNTLFVHVKKNLVTIFFGGVLVLLQTGTKAYHFTVMALFQSCAFCHSPENRFKFGPLKPVKPCNFYMLSKDLLDFII